VISVLALPLFGLTVSHEALLAAVHAAEGVMVSANVLLPAAGPTVDETADKLTDARAHGTDTRSTNNVVRYRPGGKL
jgi:hypothetical protein